jgi:hypothetical protein
MNVISCNETFRSCEKCGGRSVRELTIAKSTERTKSINV